MIRLVCGLKSKLSLIVSVVIMLGLVSPSAYTAVPTFELLQSFGKEMGAPVGKLIHDNVGNTYGVTGLAGDSNLGEVFKIDASGNYSVLHTFKGADGKDPHAGVIYGKDGKLYGTTYSGGNNDAGTIYQLDISTTTPVITVLHHFTSGVNGGYPIAALLQGADGKFYGTTRLGGEGEGAGTIFQLNTSGVSPVYKVLHSFDGTNGWYPGVASLVQGGNDKVYGVTPLGGSGNIGTLFELDISGTVPAHKVLHHFSYATNAGSPTAVIVGNDDNLYGITNNTAPQGANVFRLDLSGSTPVYTVLYEFDYANNPGLGVPNGGLSQGSDGKLYGTTYNGGSNGNGTVFRLDASASAANYTLLHEFDGVNSAKPQNGVTQGVDGKFYGSTTSGGLTGKGTIFQLDASGASPAYKDIHRFDGSGKRPGHLIQGKDGNLYGANAEHLFKFDISGVKPTTTVLANLLKDSFSRYDLYSQVNGLLQARDNKFYGIFENYSIDIADMFQLDTSGTSPTYELITSLPKYRSNSPRPRGLIQASNGKFYGATLTGGIGFSGGGSGGTIYQYDLSGAEPIYTKLHEFDGINGQNPRAGVIQASDGKLYGTTSLGGQYNLGTIFRIDISGVIPAHTVLHSFDGTNGTSAEALIQGKDGKLYGFGAIGGVDGKGILYQLDISGAALAYRVLHTFDFVGAASHLVQSRDGKFYGVTYNGGSLGKGTVFQLDATGVSPTYKVLFEFDGTTGGSPSGLLLANDGNLYGTTDAGGDFNGGVIYRIKLDNTPVNTAPTAGNDSYAFKMPKSNKAVTIAAPGVLKNDKDGEGDKLTVVGATARKPRVIVLAKGAGKVSLYPNGRLVYNRGKKCFFGSQSFTYRVTDGKAISNPARVTLTVRYR